MLAGAAGQPAEFLSLVAVEVSWSVIFVICTLSLWRMLWLDWVDVMLSMLIVRIWVMALMASIHWRGLLFVWLRLERSWSHCELEVPLVLVFFLFLEMSGSEEFELEREG